MPSYPTILDKADALLMAQENRGGRLQPVDVPGRPSMAPSSMDSAGASRRFVPDDAMPSIPYGSYGSEPARPAAIPNGVQVRQRMAPTAPSVPQALPSAANPFDSSAVDYERQVEELQRSVDAMRRYPNEGRAPYGQRGGYAPIPNSVPGRNPGRLVARPNTFIPGEPQEAPVPAIDTYNPYEKYRVR